MKLIRGILKVVSAIIVILIIYFCFVLFQSGFNFEEAFDRLEYRFETLFKTSEMENLVVKAKRGAERVEDAFDESKLEEFFDSMEDSLDRLFD